MVWAIATCAPAAKEGVRIIEGAHYLTSSSNLCRDLKLLTITDLYSLQLAGFMYCHHNQNLPIAFNNYFLSAAIVHRPTA